MTMGPGVDAPIRVAVIFQGDVADPNAWSGTPSGVSTGLEELGIEVVPIDARMRGSLGLSRLMHLDWIGQTTNPLLAAGGGHRVARALRSTPVTAAVAIGSGYPLPVGVRVATLDDLTVAQAVVQPEGGYSGLRPRQARRWRVRQAANYGRAAACCVASEWAASSLRDDYGVPPDKVHVVGLGRNSPRQVVERDWTVPRFLFIGRDWHRKRGPAVVEAFARLRARIPAATLDLVGQHSPVTAPGVSDHGFLPLDNPAARERHAELIARATCLVLPSRFEAFGIAHLDAAAAGVPSIGTTNGGAVTAIGGGGVVVNPDDNEALLMAMLDLADPVRARHLGQLAFAHSKDFTWPLVAQRIVGALGMSEQVR
jgi:glycosyltransferase involved in cell wall biosynthesis